MHYKVLEDNLRLQPFKFVTLQPVGLLSFFHCTSIHLNFVTYCLDLQISDGWNLILSLDALFNMLPSLKVKNVVKKSLSFANEVNLN